MNEMYETKYFCNSAEVSRPVALTQVDRNMGLMCSVGRLLAGVAGSWGGAAQAEHRRPHRRSHPGEPAARCGVCPEAP